MFSVSTILCALLAASTVTTSVAVTNCAGIVETIRRTDLRDIAFDITARTLGSFSKEDFSFPVEDDSGAVYLHSAHLIAPSNMPAGSVVRAAGRIIDWKNGIRVTDCTSFSVLAAGEPPKPHPITVRQAQSGDFDNRLVQVKGTVQDIFEDEIDSRYLFFTLQDDTGIIHASFACTEPHSFFNLAGSTVSIAGICHHDPFTQRSYIGRRIDIGNQNNLHILDRPSGSLLMRIPLRHARDYNPTQTDSSSQWHLQGRVIVRWQGRSILAQDAQGMFFIAEMASANLPATGETVDIIGFPHANPYQLFLTRAIWETSKTPLPDLISEPIATSVNELMTDGKGRRQVSTLYYGKPICLQGVVRSLPSSTVYEEKMYLSSDGYMIPVDISEIPETINSLVLGCHVSITGIYLLDVDPLNALATSPRIRGFFIVPRTPQDVTVLRRPSWWTTGRLLAALGILIVVLVATFIWTVLLHRTSERRGKELARAAIDQAETELRIGERTRLALELHDSISQNLTGISLELRTVIRALDQVPESVRQHVETALKAINSTRDELRNCIWDLRNRTLEEEDFESAILQTVDPVSSGSIIKVRFQVPRSIFSDTTAHAILSIIRELVTNAVRHGEADTIAIAGTQEKGRILFSVRDNGSGFDPENCLGQEQGHFGLQGVRERAKSFGGTVTIVSQPDAGTKVTVSIKLPNEHQA